MRRYGRVVGIGWMLSCATIAGWPDSIAAQPPSVERPDQPETDEERRERGRRVGALAVLAATAIGITGVGLVAWVVIWGHRLRRVARTSAGASAPRDELWYLRSRREPSGDDSEDTPNDSTDD